MKKHIEHPKKQPRISLSAAAIVARIVVAGSVAVCLSVLSGCGSVLGAKPGEAEYAPVVAASTTVAAPNPGGIYRVGSGISLFDDKRARNIGDIITIHLAESTTSSKKADTSIKKDDSIEIDAGVVLGSQPKLGGLNMATSVNPKRQFDGAGSSDQSNKLLGTITVMVSAVMPNGLLEVRGEKWMTLNRGEEFIRIRGFVRPEDVLPDNSISSTKVADVRITYSGTGEIAQSNQQGWLSRFFSSSIWPF